jgi:hypothetical protein
MECPVHLYFLGVYFFLYERFFGAELILVPDARKLDLLRHCRCGGIDIGQYYVIEALEYY